MILPENHEAAPATHREIIGELLDLSRRPLEEKRRTLLFVPRTNRPYWDLFNQPGTMGSREDRHRISASFLGPAITGFALADGAPEYHPKAVFFGYGIELVPKPEPFDHFATAAEREADVKRLAEGWGFRRILVLDHSPDRGFVLTTWEW